MSGLIGGSGSTGSSLLRQVLNRHSQIFCGPETSLFCKPQLFDDWEKNKSLLLKRGIGGLRSNSWHIYRGIDLLKEELQLSISEIDQLVEASESFHTFSESLFSRIAEKKGKTFWLEKTPGNAYNFTKFSTSFPDGKLIHITRNPYDVMASLFKRGFSHLQSVAIYLLNTSFALKANDLKNYHQINYENLVNDPEPTVSVLCEFLGFTFENEMLETKGKPSQDEPTKIGNWQYDESHQIGKKSIGNFYALSKQDQEALIYASKTIVINEALVKKEGLKHCSVEELCDALNYAFISDKTDSHNRQLKAQVRKDKVLRLRKMAFYNISNYPISINKS